MNTTVLGALFFIVALGGLFWFLAHRQTKIINKQYPPSPLPDSPEPTPTSPKKKLVVDVPSQSSPVSKTSLKAGSPKKTMPKPGSSRKK